jgi:hypothetical protein
LSGSEIKEIYNPGLRNLITVLDGNVTDGIRRWGSGKDGDIIFFSGFYFASVVSAWNDSGYDDQVRWRSEPRVGNFNEECDRFRLVLSVDIEE